jgi:hypothetical protein
MYSEEALDGILSRVNGILGRVNGATDAELVVAAIARGGLKIQT